MSYEPTTWKDGDIVTSAKLNKLEQGVASSEILVVNEEYDEDNDCNVLDKTIQEIANAKLCFLKMVEDITGINGWSYAPLTEIFSAVVPNDYDIPVEGYYINFDNDTHFYSATEDGYPTDSIPDQQDDSGGSGGSGK